jgi:enoyl-CoA hydratase/carnithine racemase
MAEATADGTSGAWGEGRAGEADGTLDAIEASEAGGPPTLRIDVDGIATVTLRRPRHLNRLHRADLAALQAHFAALRTEPAVRVLVLTATGRAFSTGFNLGELQQPDAAGQDPRAFEHTVDALERLALPTIARLNGSVYGGATDLALACDFRVGIAGMELRMPAARLGLHYYPGGLRRYVCRLGLGAAKRLFLLAQAVPAEELLHCGYLDALAPDTAALDAQVQSWAAALRAGAPLAVQGMKASLNDCASGQTPAAVLREREARCAASLDLREGLAAQAARREPRFLGR